MKLSVIVINYKSKDILNRCLNSIHSEYPHEIIVVDNDDDLPVIQRNDVRVIPFTGNLGFSGANNKAMKSASGEHILYLNADVFLSVDYIDHCIRYLEANLQCSSVQGKLLKAANPELIDSTGNVVTRTFWAFNEHHLEQDRDIPAHEIFGVCAAAGIFRRSMLEKVSEDGQYFDEDFFAYLEDVDLNIRLREAGYTAWFEPKAQALHIREASSSFGYRLSQSILNRHLLLVKHQRGVMQRLTSAISFVMILCFLPNRKQNLSKIRKCRAKRQHSELQPTHRLPTAPNSTFLRHSFKRLVEKATGNSE